MLMKTNDKPNYVDWLVSDAIFLFNSDSFASKAGIYDKSKEEDKDQELIQSSWDTTNHKKTPHTR